MRSATWILVFAAGALLLLVLRGTMAGPVALPTATHTVQPAQAAAQGSPTDATHRERVPTTDNDVGEPATQVLVTAVLPSGEPAIAATVRYAELSASQRRRFSWDARENMEEQLTSTGRQATTDERGQTTIPLGADTQLCVRCGEHYAEALAEAGFTEVHVTLQRDRTLQVQLLDSEGRPREGFDIEGNVETESRLEGTREGPLHLPPTDAHGVTVLAHAQLAMTMPGPDVVRWHMVLRCDLDPPVERSVTPAELLGEQPLQMRVPAGGAIAAEVVLADGGWTSAGVSLEDQASGTTRTPDRDDDVTWFRQLPLGRRWVLAVKSLDHVVRRELVGPTRNDEVVRTRVELPLRRIALRGRLVRPDGVPIPQADIRFAGPSAHLYRDATTSRDGSLGDTVGDFDLDGLLPADIAEITGATLKIERQPYCLETTVALPVLHRGTNELGDVVVPAPPDEVLLASVEIHAAGQDVTQSAFAYLCGLGETGINTVSSITVPRGDRIEFRGRPTDQALQIGCGYEGYLRRRVPVACGEHVVVDLLEPSASLRLHVLWPRIPEGLCSAALVDSRGWPHGDWFRTADGWHWPDLPPGRSTLRLLVDDRCVHELAVDLTPGENRWPGGGGAIDLRASAQAFFLDIRAADGGGDVELPRWYAFPAGVARQPDYLDSHELESTSRRWFVPRPNPVELAIVAEGFVPKLIPAPTADTVVPLQRCTKLVLHPALEDDAMTIVRVVEDGVRDPWLRKIDSGNFHDEEADRGDDDPVELSCVPGTVVEVVVERAGVRGSAQRVEIGGVTKEVVAR